VALFYILLLIIGIVAVGIYLSFILTQVPGVAEQRLGVLEPLPADVGKWKADEDSEEGRVALTQGLRREVRVLHQPKRGLFGGELLVRQVRYRNVASSAIERVEPEQRIRRKRIKAS
jgi:hypothetical protein